MYDRLLVPLDGSAPALDTLAWAAGIPCRRVRLLHVSADGVEQPDLAAAAALVAGNGADAEADVVPGDPAEAIVAAAASADLVVMATRARGAGGRLIFGSVADRVARHSPVPTLLIRVGARPVVPSPAARIVVPLDGSPAADRAVPVATRLARTVGAGLHLVTVVERPTGLPIPAATALHSAPVSASLADHLESLRDAAGGAGFASVEFRAGDPAEEILAVLRAGDVVAMTTHGGGGVQRWAIGAVADAILRRAPTPVLLVRADGAVGGC